MIRDPRNRRFHTQAYAFTIPELVLGILLLGAFLILAIGVVNAARASLPGRAVQIGSETLSIAPSPATFSAAVKVHSVFLERLDRARAVYVFGGQHVGLPAGASRLTGAPLRLNTIPVLNLANGLGLREDSWAFYQLHAAQLGPMVEVPAAGDFTILVIGRTESGVAATALVQVREIRVVAGDESDQQHYARREVVLYDASGEALSYTYVEPVESAQATPIGARHHWYRYEEGRVAEEGPALTIFPDPWQFSGSRRSPEASSSHFEPGTFSRFVYLLPVST